MCNRRGSGNDVKYAKLLKVEKLEILESSDSAHVVKEDGVKKTNLPEFMILYPEEFYTRRIKCFFVTLYEISFQQSIFYFCLT